MGQSISRLTFWVLAAGLALALLTFLWPLGLFSSGGETGRGAGGRPAPFVGAERIALQTFVETIEALGTARANESITVTAKVADTVSKIHFTDGQRIEKGAIIVEITRGEQDAELSAARAELAEAEKQLARLEELARSGSASQSRLDQQRAARDGARGRVEAIEARLDDRLIRAPFAGLLGLRNVSPGSLVRPGDAITTLDDISIIKVDFTVPEAFLAALAPGQKISALSAAFPEDVFHGVVVSVDSRVDPVTRAVIVRAEIPNADGRLRPGLLLSVELIRTSREAPAIAEGAIVPIGSERFVFRLDDDLTAQRVQVQTGARKPGFVEILAGASLGDLIVTEGTNKVREGAKVQLPQPPAEGEGIAGQSKGGAS